MAVWSNGSDNIILYRPYPAQFDDALYDIPKRGQQPKDVLEAKKTLLQLNFKKIIQDLEELVAGVRRGLAGGGNCPTGCWICAVGA